MFNFESAETPITLTSFDPCLKVVYNGFIQKFLLLRVQRLMLTTKMYNMNNCKVVLIKICSLFIHNYTMASKNAISIVYNTWTIIFDVKCIFIIVDFNLLIGYNV